VALSAKSTPRDIIVLQARSCYGGVAVPNAPTQSPAAAEPPRSLSSLQARKQQLVRDAIWDAAVELFIEKGFDETTVDDIAEAAGVSRRSFFRYFSSKNDLMSRAVLSYGTSLTDTVRACPASHSLQEVFREAVRKVAKQSAPGPRTRRIMSIAATYPAAREAQQARLAEVQDDLAEAFAERITRKGPGDPIPHLLAGLTLSTLHATFRMWFHSGEEQDISRIADAVLAELNELVCNAVHAARRPSKKSAEANRKNKREKR
jgi:AcrR family transcriptional regulator